MIAGMMRPIYAGQTPWNSPTLSIARSLISTHSCRQQASLSDLPLIHVTAVHRDSFQKLATGNSWAVTPSRLFAAWHTMHPTRGWEHVHN